MLSRRGFLKAFAGAAAVAGGGAALAPAAPAIGVDLAAAGAESIRGQELPPWPYPPIGQQLAADLPVIGVDKLPAPRKPKIPKQCFRPPPKNETEEQYLRRVSTPCPGMLE